MSVQARLRYLRIAPRKVRLVADLIRGKSVREAETILNFTVKKPTLPVLKLLKQAKASARNTFQLEESNLYISKITVDEGPKLKRWRARSRGQAFPIQKKTSHITLFLDEIEKQGKKLKKTGGKSKTEVSEKIQEKIKKAHPEKFRREEERAKFKKEGSGRRIFRRKAF